MIGSDGGVVSWRGSCEWNIPGQSIIRLHLCFGGTGVMSRRGRREPIFQDDRDRESFLATLGGSLWRDRLGGAGAVSDGQSFSSGGGGPRRRWPCDYGRRR